MIEYEKSEYIKKLLISFGILFLIFATSIFLHELGHHLFGLPSIMSLSHNYPLVEVTEANNLEAIMGSIAGPAVNVELCYIGLIIFVISKKKKAIQKIGYYFCISNSFFVLFATIINLIVDILSNNMENDLQSASVKLNINIFILPIIFIIIVLVPMILLWKEREIISNNRFLFVFLPFVVFILSGLTLSLIDNIFNIRFRIIQK